jgi:hypothetical protein
LLTLIAGRFVIDFPEVVATKRDKVRHLHAGTPHGDGLMPLDHQVRDLPRIRIDDHMLDPAEFPIVSNDAGIAFDS